MALWLRLLSLHIEEPSDWTIGSLHHEIRNQWLLASGVPFGGCIPVCLDKFCETKEGQAIILSAVDSLVGQLLRSPATLNQDALNLIGRDPYVGINIETVRLIEIGLAFRDLILGDFRGDVTDRSFMPGSLRNSPYDLS